MFTKFLRTVAFAALSIFAAFFVLTALPVSTASADDSFDEKVTLTLVFDHALPNVPGKSMKGVLVEYAPGGSSPAHTHPGSAFIYATVLEGAIRSKINDEPEKVYHAGENFFEVEIQTVQTKHDLNDVYFLSLPPLCCHQRQAITSGQRWRSLRSCLPV